MTSLKLALVSCLLVLSISAARDSSAVAQPGGAVPASASGEVCEAEVEAGLVGEKAGENEASLDCGSNMRVCNCSWGQGCSPKQLRCELFCKL